MTVFLLEILSFTIAAVIPFVARGAGRYIPAGLTAGLFCYFAWLSVTQDLFLNPQLQTIPWVESRNINISFLLDSFSVMFALLITGIGSLIFTYTVGYMGNHKYIGRFLAYMTAFMASMLGLVLSGDLISMFVFWELTTVTSFLLISFDSHKLLARRAAMQAMVITGGGGLCMLGGFIFLAAAAGTWDIQTINNPELFNLQQSGVYELVLILILIGAFTKSAQFPFNAWLPNAMQAPTPVSAYLHSATMVKAGVFLLMRFSPALGGTFEWKVALITAGGVTLLVGVIMALSQRDLKQVLAQTTVASLGLLVLLIGVGTVASLEAAVLYLIAHALFKGTLFMVVGGIDHATGTRDVTRLSSLTKVMPWLAGCAVLAGLSMGGLPPFGGFVAKEVMYAALLENKSAWYLSEIPTIVVFIGNILMLAAGGIVAIWPFFIYLTANATTASSTSGEASASTRKSIGFIIPFINEAKRVVATLSNKTLSNRTPSGELSPEQNPNIEKLKTAPDTPAASHPTAHDPSWTMLAGPVILSVLGLIFGLLANGAGHWMIGQAARTISSSPDIPTWNVIPHLDGALLLSLITIGIGCYAMLKAREIRRLLSRLIQPKYGPDVAYDSFMSMMISRAGKITLFVFAGNSREYIMTTFVVFGAGTLIFIWPIVEDTLSTFGGHGLILREWITISVIIIGAVIVGKSHSRLRSIAALGIVGIGVAILFMMAGAPDLSYTQFMVEVLQVTILAMVLPFLDLDKKQRRSGSVLVYDVIVSVVLGGVVFISLLAAIKEAPNLEIMSFFGEQSLVAAHGRNVVNVILVDFRALDTLGEITVVMIAGIAILSLMGTLSQQRRSSANKRASPASPLLPASETQGNADALSQPQLEDAQPATTAGGMR